MHQKRNAIASLQFLLNDNDGPMYRQLSLQITEHIRQGRLQAYDRLPGSRGLAESLGVSRSTVVNSYDRLIAEGVLISKNKSGIFVADDALLLLDQLKAHGEAEVVEPGLNRDTKVKAVPFLTFNSGIDPQAFPQQAWLKSMRASWKTPDPMVLGDNCPTGLPALKVAIADYLYQLRGLTCSPDQILITAGSRDALTLIRHALHKISSGVNWFCEDPTYPPIRELIHSWKQPNQLISQLEIDQEGCRLPCQHVNKNRETPSSAVLTCTAPSASVLTPNRQYPTGIAMSSARRQQWLSYLQEGQGWLIEDDYDNEFHYKGKNGTPLMQADSSGRVLFVGSFSKVLFRGLRLGFIVASSELYPLLQQSRNELGASAALPMQPVVAEFMQNGEFARHINRMRRHYRQKRDYLLNLCEQNLGHWFDWQQPHGGMHLLITLKPQLCSSEPERHLEPDGEKANIPQDLQIADLMHRHKIRMHPLSEHFCHEGSMREAVLQGFVLGFTGPDKQALTSMIETLSGVMSELFDD